MRYTGPKRRLSRREGIPLFKKDERFLERKGAIPPGQRGTKVRPRVTGFGTQLREKQKAKRLYGLSERQFRNVFENAAKGKGATGETMLQLLETRLDNVVYRLGLARSRPEARQLVSHGHVTVDGRKVDIPSFQVRPNQVVAISSNFVDNAQVAKNLGDNEVVPEWLARKVTVGKMLRLPHRDEMEQAVSEQLIVEFYSR